MNTKRTGSVALAIAQKTMEQQAIAILMEVFNKIDADTLKNKDPGVDYAQTLSLMVVRKMVGALVYAILQKSVRSAQKMQLTDAQLEDYSQQAYLDLRVALEDIFADGFSKGMERFSGRALDYYAQIRIMPDPINEDPC